MLSNQNLKSQMENEKKLLLELEVAKQKIKDLEKKLNAERDVIRKTKNYCQCCGQEIIGHECGC